MHVVRGQILTQVRLWSIVARGLSGCDGAHVPNDGTKGRKHTEHVKQKSKAAARGAARVRVARGRARVRALRVTTRLVLFEAI